MPIYEYRCRDCGERFEELRSVRESESDEGLECPRCGERRVERLLSAFSAFATSSPAGSSPGGSPGGSSCGPRGFS